MAARRIVISQSMLFPWVGMLEQIRLCDVYVYYDDVQFSKGSFTNRVQIKTAQGSRWMTVPLAGLKTGQAIEEVRVRDYSEWQDRHLALLEQSFRGSPFATQAVDMVRGVYAERHMTLGALARASLMALCDCFGLTRDTSFIDVRDLNIGGHGSARVLAIVQKLGGTEYITGHGAGNYLDHDLFGRAGIDVRYMAYEKNAYPQLHGPFTPFVSALDLVANCGPDGERFICSGAIDYRRFMRDRGA